MNQKEVKFHEMRSTICHVSPVPLVNPTHAVRPQPVPLGLRN